MLSLNRQTQKILLFEVAAENRLDEDREAEWHQKRNGDHRQSRLAAGWQAPDGDEVRSQMEDSPTVGRAPSKESRYVQWRLRMSIARTSGYRYRDEDGGRETRTRKQVRSGRMMVDVWTQLG